MNIGNSNPCIRCGKQRLKSKQWKEEVKNFWGTSEVTYEDWVCPDKECQKIVDQKIKADKDKKDLYEQGREERAKINKEKRGISLRQKLKKISIAKKGIRNDQQ